MSGLMWYTYRALYDQHGCCNVLSEGGMRLSKREFTVANEYVYNRSSAARWIISHLYRNLHFVLAYWLSATLAIVLINSLIPILTGSAFDAVLQRNVSRLVVISLTL